MPTAEVLKELEIKGELLAPEGAQRTSQWLLPTDVVLSDVNGQRAVRCEYGKPASPRICEDAAARTALDRLRRLTSGPAERVRDYVLRFGPLFRHEEFSGVRNPYLLPYSETRGGELVAWYREMASLLTAVTRIAACARRRERLFVADLLAVRLGLHSRDVVADYTTKLAIAACERLLAKVGGASKVVRVPFDPSAKRIVEGVVNWWLLAGDIGPRLRWRDSAPAGVVWTGGLWGAIGAQLLSDIRRGGKTAECDGCGREVLRRRRPKSGQRVWCSRLECERLRNQIAQDRLRARRRDAKVQGCAG
jgi:hypothetical protein